MKSNSKLVGLVLAHLGLASVVEIEAAHIDSAVVRIIQGQMTTLANEVIGDLSGTADETKKPAMLTSRDPRWSEAGFDNADEDMRRIFVLMYEHYGRTVEFSSGGLLIQPVRRAA